MNESGAMLNPFSRASKGGGGS